MSADRSPSRVVRVLRAVLSGSLTLGVVAAAGAAVVGGSNLLAERAAAVEAPEPAPRASVFVEPLSIEPGYAVTRRFVGQIEAGREAALSFELSGLVTEILVDEGDTVVAGQLLARLDTALLVAERDGLRASQDALAAQLAFAETRLERARALRAEGHVPQERVDEAQATRDELAARIAEVAAALTGVEIRLEKSDLRAPFAGRIGARAADLGETLAPGGPVVTLIQGQGAEVRVGLPLSVTEEMLAEATVSVGDLTLPADLIRLRPDIDAATRTRTAMFALGEAPDAALIGQTAALILRVTVEDPGAWVPLAAMREGAGGVWTVLTVEDGVVRPALVEPLHAEADRVFVRGSFRDGAALVSEGAHRVVPGQPVEMILAGS